MLVVIGGTRFVDMALKAYVFTEAEREENLYRSQPPLPGSLDIEKIRAIPLNEEFDVEDRESVKNWLARYEQWEANYSDFNYTTARRHRDASVSLSLILIGLPLYLYHWRIIRRESKEKVKNLASTE